MVIVSAFMLNLFQNNFISFEKPFTNFDALIIKRIIFKTNQSFFPGKVQNLENFINKIS